MESRLKEARKKRGLTLREVADQIGISESAVSNIERGRNKPSGSTLALFCQKLHISESWLRTGEGEMEEKDLIGDLVARYDLGPTGQALLRAVARVFAEFDEETAQRIVDDVILELQSSVADRHTHDPAAHLVPDPQASADPSSSVPLSGSGVG